MKTIPLVRQAMFCPLLCLLLLSAGCAVSEDQEIAMGRDAAPEFEREFDGLYPDEAVQTYVQQVGLRLADLTGRHDLPWQFRVLNSDQINAFALPGGYIYITQGLLGRLENEAQLAAILGHEVGHVEHRHSVQQLERANVIQGGAALAGVLTGEQSPVGDISQVVGGLLLMRYSRDQEREADVADLHYLARSGYDPHAIVRRLEIIREASGDGGPPEFLSTHPDPESREQFLRQRIEQDYSAMISAGRTRELEFRRNLRDIRPAK